MTDAERNFLYKVGRNIARLRRKQGYSQLDVCAKIQMEKSNLSSIENGRQNFTSLTLFKIANAIGVKVFDFYDLKE
ncbi:MAG: DNA-binding protein [Flavobacteriaceae bacterium]|nr:DNA-binding protein [Flavobacteriaceae bacterium]|tara:strand:+ start:14244 stop:14471 length:228 start_codon:yes stop_codon:yes gene_type:complete